MRIFVVLLTIAVACNSLGKCSVQNSTESGVPARQSLSADSSHLPEYDLNTKRQRVIQLLDTLEQEVATCLARRSSG